MANHTREILLMVGESGSGKSTYAKQYMIDYPDYVRLNRDELRIELRNDSKAPKRSGSFEQFVSKVQLSRATEAIKANKSIIIDDTNLNPNTRSKWENFARHRGAFRIYRMMTPLEDCIQNDLKRIGTSGYVGRAVIERQFLMSGRLPIDFSKKIVLCDIDGTIANSDGIRSPFDENNVDRDQVYPVVAEWVRHLKEDYTVIMVSGRHSTCGPKTVDWLTKNNIPFDHIVMRHGWDNRHDYIVKEEILNELLNIVPKEQILMVLDDRPQVINKCWRKNGIRVIPVRGECDDF